MKTAIAPRRAILAALALGWLLLTWAGAWGSVVHAARAGENDFFTFLDSCDQFQRGLSLYTSLRLVPGPDGPRPNHPNLNHPVVTLLLLPLDTLPRETAFWVWDALGVAAYGAALALAARALRLRLDAAGWLIVLTLAATAPGVLYSLQLGQFGLLLALPVVAVWLLLRDGTATPARVLAAGALTGVLLVLKPFLLPLLGLFLARRRWPGLGAAGATGVALSLLALPFVGIGAYRDWLAALHGVTWYDHGLNVSLAGLLYRTIHPAPPAFVTWLITGAVTLLGWAVISRAGGRTQRVPGSQAVRWASTALTARRCAEEVSPGLKSGAKGCGHEVPARGLGFGQHRGGLLARRLTSPSPGGTSWPRALSAEFIRRHLPSTTPDNEHGADPNPLPDSFLPDFATGLLLTLSILGSPLGWLYYTPVLIPAVLPLAAHWRTLTAAPRRLFLAAGVLIWAPYLVLLLAPDALWSQLTLRSLPLYGLALLALAQYGRRSEGRRSKVAADEAVACHEPVLVDHPQH
jgi:hypothetical protein